MYDKISKIYVIDGNAYVHRAYHALPPLTTHTGLPINAVFGFIKMIFKLLKQYRPEYLCICMDSDKPTFRHILYKDYKAKRKELEDDLKLQFPIVYEFIRNSGIPYFVVDGYEADDTISCLVKKFKGISEIMIISGDKDILQLVDKNVLVYNEHKNIIYDDKKVFEKYGVSAKQLVDYFTIVGDKVDNIDGIEGVGPKTAAELLYRFGSIEGIYNNFDNLPYKLKEKFLGKKQQLINNSKLIKLEDNIEEINKITLDMLRLNSLKIKEIKEFMVQYDMKSLLKDINDIYPKENTVYDEENKEKDHREYELLLPLKSNFDKGKTKGGKKILYVNTKELYEQFLTTLKDASKVVFNSIYFENSNKVVGILVMINNLYDNIFYIPFLEHIMLDNSLLKPLDKEYIKDVCVELFFKSYVFSITFDIKKQLRKINFFVSNYGLSEKLIDILLLAYLVDPNKKFNNLQSVVDIFLKGKNISEFFIPEDLDVNVFPVEKLLSRMLSSLEALDELYSILKEKIDSYELFDIYKKIDLPLIEILAKMEKNGILVDILYLNNLKAELEEKIKKVTEEIYKLADFNFNLNSPKQLRFILFDKLKLVPIKKKKTGYSTDEDVLQKLRNVHPIINLILQYREYEKLRTTYLEPMYNYISPTTKRIHTVFNPVGTSTGRLSSENPNMQNIPVKTDLGKRIRQIFVADESYRLVSFDYSQIELRILAHFSDDVAFKNYFFANQDIHKATAMEIFGVSSEQVDESLRRVAKVINFGIIYGMSAQGLAKELEISVEIAEDYIKRYFDKYSGVKRWIEQTIKFTRQTGYAKTIVGRIRPIPEIWSTNKHLKAFAERLAVNTPIQGTAADIIKISMIKVNEYIEKNKIFDKIKILLQIHDELIFEIKDDIREKAILDIKNIMETSIELKVPLVVDVAVYKKWGGD
ncbi:MAG: DNA polymerase I [Endomicrobia bacterium]|nr:DNA polymerase I [Endomicrobiia bacterium]